MKAGAANRTADLLLGNSCGFRLAAKRIAGGGTGADFPWPPFFTNVGYALELSLKGYILARGGTEKECRELGHDLAAATQRAQDYGMQSPAKDVIALTEKIRPYHRDHSFRYMKPIDVPNLPDVAETLVALDNHFADLLAQVPDSSP